MKSSGLAWVSILGLAVTLAHAKGLHEKPGDPGEVDEESSLLENSYVNQRLYPMSSIPVQAILHGMNQAKALKDSPGITTPWQFAGPTNVGGRVTAIAAPKDSLNIVYVGTAAGGVWKSTDHGVTFQPVFDQVGTLSIGAIAVDPENSKNLWVGTGEANPSGHTFMGTGVYLSHDAGQTFQSMGLLDAGQISKIIVDPKDSNRVYVAVLGNVYSSSPDRGVYRTTDGGVTWQKILFVADDAGAIQLEMDPRNPQKLFAAIWEVSRTAGVFKKGGAASGIYLTQNGGDSWSKVEGGLPASVSTTGRIGIAIAPSDPNVIYASYDKADVGFDALYRSDDGGVTWKNTGAKGLSDVYSNYGWWFGNLTVDPQNPHRLYVLGLFLDESWDGGASFKTILPFEHSDHHAMDIVSDGTIYEGNDGGLIVENGANTEHPNLPITQFYSVTVDPKDSNRVYGGTQDNGTVRTISGHTDDWTQILGADGFQVRIDPTNSKLIYAEAQYGSLEISTDDAQSFNSIDPPATRSAWDTPIRIDPSTPSQIYVGAEKLYLSPDRGAHWEEISPEFEKKSSRSPLDIVTQGVITSFDISATDPNTIYVGMDDGKIWVTRDSGTDWQQLNAGLPQRWLTSIRTRPGAPNEAYVTFSGYFWNDKAAHVWKTTDYGNKWVNISGNLPDAPVNVIEFDSSNTLYVGTDVGVFSGSPGPNGYVWSAVGTDLPSVSVMDLVFDRHAGPRGGLVAATHGRGIYRLVF